MTMIKNDVAFTCSSLKNTPNYALHSDICQNWGIDPLFSFHLTLSFIMTSLDMEINNFYA